LEDGCVADALVALTGGVTKQIKIKKDDKSIWDVLNEYASSKWFDHDKLCVTVIATLLVAQQILFIRKIKEKKWVHLVSGWDIAMYF
jgi:hypothetical protein